MLNGGIEGKVTAKANLRKDAGNGVKFEDGSGAKAYLCNLGQDDNNRVQGGLVVHNRKVSFSRPREMK